MASRFTELAIDCAEPGALARFWCSVLDYEVQAADDETVTIGPAADSAASSAGGSAAGPAAGPAAGSAAGSAAAPGGRSQRGPVPPVLTFARVPEGKTVKNRLHLDVSPADREQDDEVRRLLGLGARPADVGQGDTSWVVLADPEGNEFCVLAARRP